MQILAFAAGLGLLAGCTQVRESFGYAQPKSLDQLPAAAQQTVHHEIGNQPIARISEEITRGQRLYRVEVARPGLNPVLWVTPDGAVAKESGRLAKGRVSEAAGSQAPPSTSKDYP